MTSQTAAILAGATGFAGSHCLLRLLTLPDASNLTIYLPLRKPLPPDHIAVTHPCYVRGRIHEIIRSDLATAFADPADTEMVDAFKASRALIWCIGAPWGDFVSHSIVDYVHLTHSFTLAAAKALISSPPPVGMGKKTFVYCSGRFVTRDEDASQGWIKSEWITRDVKGRTEKDLIGLARSGDSLAVRIVRPAGILGVVAKEGKGLFDKAMDSWTSMTVRVDTLASAMVELALEDAETAKDGEKDTWENEEIVGRWGSA